MSRWVVAGALMALGTGVADARTRLTPQPAPLKAPLLTRIDYRLQPARTDDRFLLPTVDSRYEQAPAKPRVRVRGTRVKLRLPI